MIGQTISHYRILEKLGEGGMGVVYKAQDLTLDRIVALKFLPPRASESPETKARFLQEAKAAAALNHPDICTIHGVEEHDGTMFIVMEYIQGGTLRNAIAKGNLSMDNALAMAVHIGEALQEAHSKGIVHRDIKADNIMLTARGQAKVMDFGLAKLKGSLKLTRTSSTVGTLAYMAPEQIQGGEVDSRSDIFAFGVLLFEMLTGRLPFRGEHEAAMMYSILNEAPDSLSIHIPDASPELLHILNRSLEKNPEDRYQSVGEMVIDLHRLRKETTKVFRPQQRDSSSPAPERVSTTSRQSGSSAPSPQTSDQAHRTTSVTINIPRLSARSLRAPGIVAGIVVLLAAAYFFFMAGPTNEGKRVPVVVADFVNDTKESELDGLSGMLITALEQSRKLDVLPRSRMFDILKQLGKTTIDRIDESLGKDICKHAGINSLILTSIRKFGKVYTIDLKVVDPKEGKYLFTATETAEGQESIPSLLDKLSKKTREGFQEQRTEILSASKNVAEITTSNMQAYQYFFQGEQLMNRVQYREAPVEYRKAIALDSTFGLAYYRLAYAVGWEVGGDERAEAPLQKSIALIDRIPDKERYLVRALAAQLHQGFAAGVAVLREMEKMYPNEKEMLYNIGDWSWHDRDLKSAAEYLERVAAMDPTMERMLEHLCWTYRDAHQYEKMLNIAKRYAAAAGSEEAYTLLADAYVELGRLEEGLKALQQARDFLPGNLQLTGAIAELFGYKGEYAQAESELQPLIRENQPLQTRRFGVARLASLTLYSGKYQESMSYLDKTIAFYGQLHDTAGVARTILTKALRLVQQRNDLNGALRIAEKTFPWQSRIQDINYWALLAELYVFRKDVPAAEAIFTTRVSSFKWVDAFYRTLIYNTNHECSKAEVCLDTVLNSISTDLNIFLLYPTAECQFEASQFDKAVNLVTRLQRVNNNERGYRSFYYPRSFMLLGKIYEKKGDRKLAIENFEKFLNLWKDADKDLPDLIDAKARLTKLKAVASK